MFKVVDCLNICSTRFLYTLYIAVDGNFKLKGKKCHLTDMELMPEWAAYFPKSEYKAHLTKYVNQPKVSKLSIGIDMTLINSSNISTDQHLRVTA
jgi:hypothetical protein